jgi:glyceraldehyde 3-phosphate dehydrogenase
MRAAANKPNINIVAVNDPFIPVEYMEYMYKYDSTHGRVGQEVSHDASNNTVIVDGKPIKVFDQMDPSKIDWVRIRILSCLASTRVLIY